ncbi:MAG: hypothetical protein JWM80_5954 [Cyanobacteria bacterium RYN_339]|nr:hypothetical protein [Cyanobacteria bacterium RYN_339]
MQCATCLLPLPSDGPGCPLCPQEGLAPALAVDSGLAPVLAPLTIELAPGAAWRHALEEAAPGTTVRLQPGLYRFEGELALPAGITLEGAGRELTTLEGLGASGRCLLNHRGPGLFQLRGVEVRPHQGFWQRLVGGGERPHLLGMQGGAYLVEGCSFDMADGVRAAGDAGVPGTVVGCRFTGSGAVGLTTTGALWVEACEFVGLAKGIDASRGRLVVRNSRFEANAIGVAWDDEGYGREPGEAGCMVARCAFRDNRETVQPKPPWRCRWNDNRYEGPPR